MTAYLIRRILRAVTTLLGTTLIIFLLVRVVPADPAVSIAGPKADPETLAAIRKDLGLDAPLAVQYGRYVWALAHGDLGRSYLTGRRVSDVIAARVPATALLGATSLGVGFVLGLVVGVGTAARRGSAIDVAVLLVTLVGLSIPVFWLGNILIYEFSYRLKLLPLGGYGTTANLVLPAATLGIMQFFFYARFVHTNVAGTLASDYIRTARAKGFAESMVVVKHAFRNACIPVITVLGLQFGQLLGGAIVTETVFAWPGVATLVVDSIRNQDFPVVQCAVVLLALIIVAVNFVVDMIVGFIDPRIRVGA